MKELHNEITHTKQWSIFCKINDFMMHGMVPVFWVSFIFIIYLLDSTTRPADDEVPGIYFGFVVVSLPLSTIIMAFYGAVCHGLLRTVFPRCYKFYNSK